MIITRAAPSPTGDPHVGTAYAGLFNYVWAKKNGGRFILRIEDTDQSRYVAGAEERILGMLHWLGLNYDEGPDIGGPNAPYRQSERSALYRRYADELLASGKAYRAFETAEELEAIREEQKRRGLASGYDGRARAIDPAVSRERAERGEPHVVRLKVPRTGQTIVADGLRGAVSYENSGIQDVVLLKSDGLPTYHLANVVDDHLMAVTDVIRGEEWLSSAPIHVLLYQAFDWSAPNFYHLPVLRNPDKSKLSKRKGNTSVEWYRSQGILPQALLNYLGMMGFSMPDGRELFSLEEMIAEFSWERVSLGGPVFDYEKLKWLNGKYIREVLSLPELSALVRPWLAARGFEPSEEYLQQVTELMRTRFETLAEFVEKTPYFFTEDYPTGEKAAATLSEGQEILRAVLPKLAELAEFSHAATEPVIRGLAESLGLKPAKVMQPLRAALTGTLESPGMFELLEVLGKERVLSRLERAMAGVAR